MGSAELSTLSVKLNAFDFKVIEVLVLVRAALLVTEKVLPSSAIGEPLKVTVFLSADSTPVRVVAEPAPVGVKDAVTASFAATAIVNAPAFGTTPRVVAVVPAGNVDAVTGLIPVYALGTKPLFQSLMSCAANVEPGAAAGTDCCGLLRSSKLNNLLTPPLI